MVSSLSPENIEFAPAIKHNAWASGDISVRPADNRTILAGIIMRAVAIIRTISHDDTGILSSKGVPSMLTNALMGTYSGCLSNVANVSNILIRSESLSPMPMIPPEQMVTFALRVLFSVSSRSS